MTRYRLTCYPAALDTAEHLAELVAAAELDIDPARVAAYRALLTQRKATVTA
ncbi:hypothetical protein [Actinomadura rupiterrae]|uniref:hypothetical protein n=1 Tax=Actinomadura rupiterrae TaxID=559627 RepID=UPI0020A38E65|nr:hypothetical protein [Actinomadura rupiterrae]MCP2337321.1 hypothetical protein [Actinomadura rupiterrae]